MSKAIGSRWECLCCGRISRIRAKYDGGYEYEFEEEPFGSRWISEGDAIIRFRPIGDDLETLRRKMEKMQKK